MASVIRAERRSLIRPCFSSGANGESFATVFELSWLLISCWQQGTERMALACVAGYDRNRCGCRMLYCFS